MENKTLVTILRWIAIIPAVLVTELILRGIIYLLFTPDETSGTIYLFNSHNAYIWLAYFVFGIIDTVAFVKVGTIVAPQKGKRAVSITLAVIRCIGNFGTCGILMMLADDFRNNICLADYLPAIVSSIVAIACIYEQKKPKISAYPPLNSEELKSGRIRHN